MVEQDILSCLTTLTAAGLDTVAAQSSWTMLHLATHPEHRARLVAAPEMAAYVVEESLRTFPIAQSSRTAIRDGELAGCPIRKGDNAVFSLTAAGRDPERYPHADEFDMDRSDTRHVSLGHGPHTCLGAHLARQEMALLLEEWHRRIPEYSLVGWPTETAGAVRTVDALRLAW